VNIKSISEIDLSRPALRNDHVFIDRSWENEIIYFLIVDRFHDGENHEVEFYSNRQENESSSSLMKRCGGTFRGIRSQLEYIKNLGCTCIWLSPVFENFENSYHGYAISNFLTTDPKLGTIEEFKLLVKEAHLLDIRIVLDIVINHTADTWNYKEGNPFYTGSVYEFGDWKNRDYPVPTELRNPSYYKRSGAIRHWDSYPETQEGDIFELKKLLIEESPNGKEVMDLLISIYCYWIKETEVDGFRLDTVKHMKTSSVAIFCSAIRDYAKYLGKNSFMIFGEVVGGDALIAKYLKTANTSEGYKKGLDAVLDFPLHFILEDVIKGKRSVRDLYLNYRSKEKMLAKQNKQWKDLVVFADNHDQIGQEHKSRLAHESDEMEVLAIIGFLYFMYGIPCLYYGTEQLFKGNGQHDSFLREVMFDKSRNKCFQNKETFLYKEISRLAALKKSLSLFNGARLEIDQLSVNEGMFISSEYCNEVIYWSKRIFEDKLILLYNPQKTEKASICAKLSTNSLRIKNKFEYVYGGLGEVIVEEKNNCGYINIDLNPQQFVILK
jgi:glycosidase